MHNPVKINSLLLSYQWMLSADYFHCSCVGWNGSLPKQCNVILGKKEAKRRTLSSEEFPDYLRTLP